MKKLLIIILTSVSLNCFAQGWVNLSGTVAQNYLEDVHGNIELIGGYNYENFSFNLGSSLLFTKNEVRFDALQVQASYLFKILTDLRFFIPKRFVSSDLSARASLSSPSFFSTKIL